MVNVKRPTNPHTSCTQQYESYEEAIRRAKEEDARELEEFNRSQRRYKVTEDLFQDLENEDDDEYQDEIDFITEGEVVKLWSQIEKYRRAIAWQEARFNRWLEVSPQLAKHWKQFIDAGGVTARDWEKFCQGAMRHRSTREKQHLRLVSTKRNVVRRHRLNQTGNDAA